MCRCAVRSGVSCFEGLSGMVVCMLAIAATGGSHVELTHGKLVSTLAAVFSNKLAQQPVGPPRARCQDCANEEQILTRKEK